jgi:hypothetical protein
MNAKPKIKPAVQTAVVTSTKAPETAPASSLARVADETAGLPMRQRTALVALAAGRSYSEAARMAGVGRQTLYEWRQKDARFAAVLNAWQRTAVASAQQRLLAVLDDAVTAVCDAITTGSAPTALAVLKQMGVLTPTTPGPIDPKEVSQENSLTSREEHFRQLRREQFIKQDGVFARMGG